MNTIPLVKGNTQEEINISLIALKKALDEMNSSSSKTDASVQSQIKQINELITNINSQITDLQPVDSVTSGNMHSVTSNAVAESCCRFPNYADIIVPPSVSWVAPVDCYMTILQVFNYDSSAKLYIDGNVVSVSDTQTDLRILAFNGYVKKGQRVYYDYLTNTNLCKIFALS